MIGVFDEDAGDEKPWSDIMIRDRKELTEFALALLRYAYELGWLKSRL